MKKKKTKKKNKKKKTLNDHLITTTRLKNIQIGIAKPIAMPCLYLHAISNLLQLN
jgi:hypothetical protein